MAWTVTTYQTGQLISEVELNLLRDNFNALARHNHGSSTGSGAGAPEIGNATAGTGVGYVQHIGVGTSTGNPANPTSGSGDAILYGYQSGTQFRWRNGSGTIYLFIRYDHTHAGI